MIKRFCSSKASKLILAALAALAMLSCFVFALLFSIAGLSAIAQASITQLIVLFGFCYLFSLAGNSFLTITDLLYASMRR